MAASPNVTSFMAARVFSKDEATAAQATVLFFLTNSADGTPATGKTIATTDFKISKNGAAFGNAAGTVTEMSLGWYKMVFAAADLDTAGDLACELSGEAGVDPIHQTHKVQLRDDNTAEVAATIAAGDLTLDTDTITDDSVSADAVTKIQTGLASTSDVEALSSPLNNVTVVLGTLDADGSTAGRSMQNAIKSIVTLAGTWDGATVTVQYCPNPLATVPQWLAVSGGAKTSDGQVTVSGPVNAIRATMSDDGASSEVVCTAEISYPRS